MQDWIVKDIKGERKYATLDMSKVAQTEAYRANTISTQEAHHGMPARALLMNILFQEFVQDDNAMRGYKELLEMGMTEYHGRIADVEARLARELGIVQKFVNDHADELREDANPDDIAGIADFAHTYTPSSL